MSEKRFKPYSVSTTDNAGFVIGIQKEDGTVMSITDASEMLNKQQATIESLERENEQLRRYVYHCPQICNKILAYLRKSETEDVKAVSDAMGDDKYFDEEIDTLRSWE